MKITKILFILIFLTIIGFLCTSFSSMRRYYWINNMTGNTITIEAELERAGWEGFGNWYGVYQNESHEKIGFMIYTSYSEPVFSFAILPYTEIAPFASPPTMRLREIPPLQRLRLAFASFIIKDEANNIIKTLDTITEDDIIMDEYGDVFLLIR